MEAIQKLRSEMDANKNDAYIQSVGGELIKFIEAHPDTAEKFLDKSKTIAGSYSEMEKQARQKTKGNQAFFTPQQGFEIIMKYFGVTAGTVPVPEIEKPAPAPVRGNNFDINLEDLL